MSKQSSPPRDASGHLWPPDTWEDEVKQDDFKPMTPEEAIEWRARQPKTSVWQVVRWQLILAAVVTLVAALVTSQASIIWSVAYGALCIVLPTVLMVYGISTQALSRWFRLSRRTGVGASLASMFFWEGIKIFLAVIMMWSAPYLIPDLSWLGLLAGLVVVLKAYWLALLLGRHPKA